MHVFITSTKLLNILFLDMKLNWNFISYSPLNNYFQRFHGVSYYLDHCIIKMALYLNFISIN